MNKTQALSASRAGLGSAIVTNAGTIAAQLVSSVGVVQSLPSGVFVIHPFL